MQFWDRVKEELEFKGISQKEFANLLGLNVQSFRNSISLNRLPDLELAYKMAQELKQPLEYFINGDIFPPNNYHLPTREIKLLENYRKLSNKEKNSVDALVQSLSSEYKENIQEDIF